MRDLKGNVLRCSLLNISIEGHSIVSADLCYSVTNVLVYNHALLTRTMNKFWSLASLVYTDLEESNAFHHKLPHSDELLLSPVQGVCSSK
jgi:hypothetical protein